MLIERPKNPARVKGGQVRQARLRAALGEQGYRAYQQALYTAALEAHPTLHSYGALAANLAQLRAWGVEGYVQQRRSAYRACQSKHGESFARRVVAAANAERRRHRLDHPTPGEAMLRAHLADVGFHVWRDPEHFDYIDWRVDPLDWRLAATDVFAEGRVGPYYCDLLLPVWRLAIEVEGGVHVLTRERDARRRAFLEAQGLTVLALTEEQALDPVIGLGLLTRTLDDLRLPWFPRGW